MKMEVLFAFECQISVPFAIQLAIDKYILIVEQNLLLTGNTVQLSLVGTHASFFSSSSVLSNDPSIVIHYYRFDYYNKQSPLPEMKESQSSEWKRRKIIKKQKIYECGCGKKYKVYNSLQTHIKGVHNGISPGPVKLPEKSSRGRPKQHQFKEFEQFNEDSTNPLQLLLQKVGEWTSSQLNLKEIYEKQPVYKLIVGFSDPKDSEELKFIEEDKIYQVTMGKGLLILISELKTVIHPEEFLDQLVLLITAYISYIIEQTEDQNVLSNGSIGLLPEFVNYFLVHDYQKRCQRLKLKNLWINSIENIVQVFNIVFRWLIFKRFTYTKATINNEYLKPIQENDQQN